MTRRDLEKRLDALEEDIGDDEDDGSDTLTEAIKRLFEKDKQAYREGEYDPKPTASWNRSVKNAVRREDGHEKSSREKVNRAVRDDE